MTTLPTSAFVFHLAVASRRVALSIGAAQVLCAAGERATGLHAVAGQGPVAAAPLPIPPLRRPPRPGALRHQHRAPLARRCVPLPARVAAWRPAGNAVQAGLAWGEGAGDESAVRYQSSGLKGFPRPRVLCADLPAAQVAMDFLEIDKASRQRELAGQISQEGLLRQSLESWSSAGSVFVDAKPEAVKTEARGWWLRLPRPAWWDEGVDKARGQASPALTNSTRSGEVSPASSWVRRQR